jgi:hypothetical protein
LLLMQRGAEPGATFAVKPDGRDAALAASLCTSEQKVRPPGVKHQQLGARKIHDHAQGAGREKLLGLMRVTSPA